MDWVFWGGETISKVNNSGLHFPSIPLFVTVCGNSQYSDIIGAEV